MFASRIWRRSSQLRWDSMIFWISGGMDESERVRSSSSADVLSFIIFLRTGEGGESCLWSLLSAMVMLQVWLLSSKIHLGLALCLRCGLRFDATSNFYRTVKKFNTNSYIKTDLQKLMTHSLLPDKSTTTYF